MKTRSRSPRKTNPFTEKPYSENYFTLLSQRKSLPVYKAKKSIQSAISSHKVLILEGETGSGKTTQIPQFLLSLSPGCIGVTQPRRISAISIAKRVSEEMDVKLGEEVGYSVRFDDCCTPNTRIKYLTDGMLIRESMLDPSLSAYSIIILDEAHERTVATDILFGLLKQLLSSREDLRIIVMSATLQSHKFASYFQDPPLLQVPGRVYPVQTLYAEEAEEDYVKATVATIVQIHAFSPEGDILAFLTGEEEIEQACEAVRREVKEFGNNLGPIAVLPLYSSLPPSQQQRVFCSPPSPNKNGMPGRKCIICTNIAETSVTIDGIVYVIDCGLVKQKNYHPNLEVESLQVGPISKSAAKQRTGRAGRTKAGICYRLYTELTYKNLTQNTHPEILRSNLASIVLSMLKIGITDFVHFDFVDPPTPQSMMRALETLHCLGAIDSDCAMTEEGSLVAEFPLDPQLGKILVQSARTYNCSEEISTLVSMLSTQNPYLRPKNKEEAADYARSQFIHQEGDHLELINLMNAYVENGKSGDWCSRQFLNPRALKGAFDIREQLRKKMKHLGLEIASSENSVNIRRCIMSGFFLQVAYREKSKYYRTLKDDQLVALHPSNKMKLKPEWCVYHEYVLTSRNFVKTVSKLRVEWILEHPYYSDLSDLPDSKAKRELHRLRS